MGNCVYCGLSAGLFRSKHKECEVKEQLRIAEVKAVQGRVQQVVVTSLDQDLGVEGLLDLVSKETQSGNLTAQESREAVIAGWCNGVDKCLEDGVIDAGEEKGLVRIKRAFDLSEDELDKTGDHTRFVQAAVIRDLLNGILPRRYEAEQGLPINLQKNEKVVWAFHGCDYLEDKTKRTYQGGSRGVSVKVMKGVYYRVGAFKGEPVFNTERVKVDSGAVYVTNKHIYFAGENKSLRVPYSKIVSFLPFTDAVGVIRDAQTAKPQIFKTGEGWFTYNLVTNLAQLDSQG